jgi:hypothetical protein
MQIHHEHNSEPLLIGSSTYCPRFKNMDEQAVTGLSTLHDHGNIHHGIRPRCLVAIVLYQNIVSVLRLVPASVDMT